VRERQYVSCMVLFVVVHRTATVPSLVILRTYPKRYVGETVGGIVITVLSGFFLTAGGKKYRNHPH
jgi:hypothetical protein